MADPPLGDAPALGAGGTVYRTHDAGYLMVRHGDGHPWRREDAGFLDDAESVHPGWQPALAGLRNLPPPAGIPDALRNGL